MARSISSSAARGLFIGSEATNAGNSFGHLRHISAMPSFATRANSGECEASPSSSGLGRPSVSTCCTSRNFSRSMATRCSMSHSMRRLDMRFTMPGSLECCFTKSRYACGMTWL